MSWIPFYLAVRLSIIVHERYVFFSQYIWCVKIKLIRTSLLIIGTVVDLISANACSSMIERL